MLKFSLGTLFIVVAAVALGCAAIANFSELWAEAMVTLVVAMLFAGLLIALVARGDARIFATGFVAIGGLYFLLTFAEAFGLRDQLLTSRAVHWLYGLKQGDSSKASSAAAEGMYGGMDSGMSSMSSGGMSMGMSGSAISEYSGMMGGGGTSAISVSRAPRELQDIGHTLWTFVLALCGGVLAQIIHRKSRRHETSV